jgi:hypothetical protein
LATAEAPWAIHWRRSFSDRKVVFCDFYGKPVVRYAWAAFPAERELGVFNLIALPLWLQVAIVIAVLNFGEWASHNLLHPQVRRLRQGFAGFRFVALNEFNGLAGAPGWISAFVVVTRHALSALN